MPLFAHAAPTTTLAAPARSSPRHRSAKFLTYQISPRLLLVLVLTTVAFFIPIVDTMQAAASGSRAAYLLTAPVLVAMIMTGYRHPPRGVGDAESDWIVAAALGLGGLVALELIIRRLPTVGAQWHLPNVQMVLWLIASSMVVFTVRHVVRLWKAWLFGFGCALVMPYLLMLAGLGGSDTAAALLAVALASLATLWAARFARWFWRIAGTTSSLCHGVLWVFVLADTNLLIRVLVAAGAVPVLSVLALNKFSKGGRARRRFAAVTTKFPHRHPASYVVLAVLSVLVLLIQLPRQRLPDPPAATPEWTQHLGLSASAQFPFIENFVGPGTTLSRYPLPNRAGQPAAVVDVITARNLAAMRDFRDAVWYPHTEPVNYVRDDIKGAISVQARSVHNFYDSAVARKDGAWYAITWAWHAGDVFQRVMIVVNQDSTSSVYPPAPEPITFANTFTLPLVWIMRQQPKPADSVDPVVVARAQSVALEILAAGARRD